MKRIPLLALGAALLSACGGQLQLPNLPELGGNREQVALKLQHNGFSPVLQVTGLTQPAELWYRIGDLEEQASSTEAVLRGFCPGDNSVQGWVRRGERELARETFALSVPLQGAISLQAPAQAEVVGEDALEIPFDQAAEFGCAPRLQATAPGVTVGEPQLVTRDGKRLFRVPLVFQAGHNSATLQLRVVQGGASAQATVSLSRPAATPGPVPVPAPTVRVRLVGEERVSLPQGTTLRFPAEVSTTGGASPALVYTSSTPAVATVTADGEIRALTAGETVLEATAQADPSQKVRLTVIVTPPPSFGLNLSSTSMALTTGQSQTVTVGLSPQAGYSGTALLTVQAPAGVTVSPASGEVSASKPLTLTVRGDTAGTHELRLLATDSKVTPPLTAGATVTVTVTAPAAPAPPADAPPTIHSVNLAGIAAVERSPQPVEVHATDDRGIASVQLWVAGQKVQDLSLQGDRYRADWNLSGIPNGPAQVQVRVTDSAGQVSVWERTVNVQLTAGGLREVGRFQLSAPPTSNLVVSEAGDLAFVGTGSGLTAITLASGEMRTLLLPGGTARSLLMHGGTLYVVTGDDQVLRIAPASLSIVGADNLPARATSALAAGPAGVYVGTETGVVRADLPGTLPHARGQRVTSLAVGERVYAVTANPAGSTLSEVAAAGNSLSIVRSVSAQNLAWVRRTESGRMYGSGSGFGPLWLITPELSLSVIELGTFDARVSTVSDVQGVTVVADREGTVATAGARQKVGGRVEYSMWHRGDRLYVGDGSGNLTVFEVREGSLKQLERRSGLGNLYGDLTGDREGRVVFLSVSGRVIVYAPQ